MSKTTHQLEHPDNRVPTVAVVIPCYNEQRSLDLLYRRLSDAFRRLPRFQWSVIYVNDGSLDNTKALILQQHLLDPRFALVDLSRNFGHQSAISAGLAHADADAVIIMDADLQDPPEVIPELVREWQSGAEVVLAQRRSRAEHGVRRLGFELFHRVFGWISDFPIPSNMGVFGLLDRRAVQELVALTERNRFIPGLRTWIGFEQRVVFYDRHEREAGQPSQSLTRLVRYACDAIFSFSYKPLRLMTALGAFISLFGFLAAAYFIVKRLIGAETAITGFTTLVTILLFLGGLQLIAIGLVGEYLGRVYDEVKNRPLFVVRETHGLAKESGTLAAVRER